MSISTKTSIIILLVISITIFFSSCNSSSNKEDYDSQPEIDNITNEKTPSNNLPPERLTEDGIQTSFNGIVNKVLENGILVNTTGQSNLQVMFIIDENTQFIQGISKEFEKGNIVSVETDGSATRSVPPQMTIITVLENKLNDDVRIGTDVLNGLVPVVVLEKNNVEAEVLSSDIFAIKLKYDDEWQYESSTPTLELLAQGIVDESIINNQNNSSFIYYAFTITQKGEHNIIFTQRDERISFQIFVDTKGGDR